MHFQTITLLNLKKELAIVNLLSVLLSSFQCRSVEADRDEEMKRLKHSFERQVHRHCMVTILHLTRRKLSWGRRVWETRWGVYRGNSHMRAVCLKGEIADVRFVLHGVFGIKRDHRGLHLGFRLKKLSVS